jgi:plasmid maintenance system killer protein
MSGDARGAARLTGQAKSEPIRYSIHVNGPWTLTFEWDAKAGEAVGVDLVQYH